MTTYKIQYDTKKYPFREIIHDMMKCYDETPAWISPFLEKIHLDEEYDLLERSKDQSTIWHKAYYTFFENRFKNIYISFIEEVIKPHFKLNEIIYQKIPTFRVHLVNNLGVGEWHKDKTYNHGITEINCWLPFTDAYDTNTIWLESEEDKGDFEPQTVIYGEVLIFDGANLMHGNKINKTSNTRVSVDFRIVDPKFFIPNKAGSINTGAAFDIGGYFDKI